LLDDMAAVVSAVITPANDALVSFYLLAERVLPARKYDTHGRSAAMKTEDVLVVEEM
jgi:hypothetical protein